MLHRRISSDVPYVPQRCPLRSPTFRRCPLRSASGRASLDQPPDRATPRSLRPREKIAAIHNRLCALPWWLPAVRRRPGPAGRLEFCLPILGEGKPISHPEWCCHVDSLAKPINGGRVQGRRIWTIGRNTLQPIHEFVVYQLPFKHDGLVTPKTSQHRIELSIGQGYTTTSPLLHA